MNFLTFFTLISNFLAFWGISLFVLINSVEEGVSGAEAVGALLFLLAVAFVFSLIPYIVPTLVTALLGLNIAGHGDGVWILEFLGTALFISSIGVLVLLGQVDLDSLKARYWRHMWTHKSPLEARMGASSPYVATEMDDNLVTFFLPVLWPFVLSRLLVSPQTVAKPEPPPEKPIPWFDPNKISGRLALISEHLARDHNSRGLSLGRMVETAEGLESSKREKLDRVVGLLDRMEASPSGLTKKEGYELSQLVIQLWKGIGA